MAASADLVPWSAVQASLRALNRRTSPHLLVPWRPESARRAAVAVVLWGDAAGARKVVLALRGRTAPRHAGELAFPGGMVEPWDRDLCATARRELAEELGVTEDLWELGCIPDGVAKAQTRFTPVLFRWEPPEPRFQLGSEVEGALMLGLRWLMEAPWVTQRIEHQGRALEVPRLELEGTPLWGATALVLKAWLDVLGEVEARRAAP